MTAVPDGRHKQYLTVVVPALIANTDVTIMRYGESHYSGLLMIPDFSDK